MINKLVILLVSSLGLLSWLDTPVTIHLIGDSTVSTYPPEYYPRMGWGQTLDRFFSDEVIINNKAVSGRSTRSFIEQEYWPKVVEQLQAGDYLFIQFGHNDQKQDRPDLYAAADGAFQDNLRRFVQTAREKKCHPVLITPVARRRFRDGQPYSSHEGYPDAVREVAQQEGVPLIDLHARSLEVLAKLGAEESKALYLWLDTGEYEYYPEGREDDTHFSEYGAQQVCHWVTEAIHQLDLPIEQYILPEPATQN